jgi:hypothetical protein
MHDATFTEDRTTIKIIVTITKLQFISYLQKQEHKTILGHLQ